MSALALVGVAWIALAAAPAESAALHSEQGSDSERVDPSAERVLGCERHTPPEKHEDAEESLRSHEGAEESPVRSHEAAAESLRSHEDAAEPLRSHEDAAESLRAAGILLRAENGARYTPEDVQALAEGLQRLPPALRKFPGGPLTFVLRPERRVTGMGDESESAPEWADGRGQFFLYDVAPEEEPYSGLRLRYLDTAQRRRLWRQRAVIHAVLARWDAVLALSRRPGWRKLSGWLSPFERPLTWKESALNTFEGAYSRRAGQRTAELDLLTFAEERFAPPESLGPGVEQDDTIECRERSKTRVFDTLLTQSGLAEERPPARCPAFEAWADEQSLSHLEVLLVAASGRRPESLFGHLALQLVRKEGATVRGPSFASVVQLVALTGDMEGGWSYLWRGLTGGFSAGVVTTAMAGVAHQSLEREQRSIRRYRLNLSSAEQAHLLDRIWELERRGYFDYFFFTDNCAALLVVLLNGALDEGREIFLPSRFSPLMPGAALDALAQVKSANAAPLLTFVPGSYECTREIAERALAQRQERLDELTAALSASDASALRALHEQTQSPDRLRRARAHRHLLALISRVAPSFSPRTRDGFYVYLLETVRLERFALDALEQRALERAKLYRVARATAQPFDAQLERRQQAFASEQRVRKSRLILDNAQEVEDSLTEQLVREGDLQLVGQLAEARAVYAALSDGQAELVDSHFSEVDAQLWRDEDAKARAREEEVATSGALTRSGFARTALAAGARASGAEMFPILTLRTAGFLEELGERRLHGFSTTSELRLLEGTLSVQPRAGWPRIVASDLTVGSYRTLRRELPILSTSFLDAFGWGAEGGWRYDVLRPLPYEAALSGEALGVLGASRDWGRFLAVGLGPVLTARFSENLLEPAAGARATLTERFHFGGSTVNALRLDASFSTQFVPGGWLHDAQGRLRIELAAGTEGHLGVRMGPRLTARWTLDSRTGQSLASASAEFAVELL